MKFDVDPVYGSTLAIVVTVVSICSAFAQVSQLELVRLHLLTKDVDECPLGSSTDQELSQGAYRLPAMGGVDLPYTQPHGSSDPIIRRQNRLEALDACPDSAGCFGGVSPVVDEPGSTYAVEWSGPVVGVEFLNQVQELPIIHPSVSQRSIPNRNAEARRYSVSFSKASQVRPSCSAMNPVVLLPANGSKTSAPGSVKRRMKNREGRLEISLGES